MPTKYTRRIVLIVFIVVVALIMICPNPLKLFDSKATWAQRLNLKPGIDMVGGTSLLYEIKSGDGGTPGAEQVRQVMDALKNRVDPKGVRNLVWRPQGATRLEIQMPISGQSDEAIAKRDAYSQSQQALEASNVRIAAVLRAVETLAGDERADTIKTLASGSEVRETLFGALRSVWDQIDNAKKQQNAAAQAKAELDYAELKSKVDAMNLSIAELESILTQSPKAREQKLAALKQRFAGFAPRLAAIDNFAATHDEYEKVKGSLDDAAALKRLLKGSGVLEFHILVSDVSQPDAQEMIRRLAEKGPRPQTGDTMQWFLVDQPAEFSSKNLLRYYNEKPYVLAFTTSEMSLTNSPGRPAWALEGASRQRNPSNGQLSVGFQFDQQGARYFSELTGRNVGRPLAIVLDNKIISAPNINSQIGRSGEISGEFSTSEIDYMVRTLNAGSLPAQLNDEPLSERTVGPQLGRDNLLRGLYSCIFGVVVVAVFMTCYYYLSGIVATIAVVLNLILILGAMAALEATFTLPSIAGIILTIGMAVDANVLIFERLREEQLRGLSLRMALRNAYDRAWSAILDGNVTTGITALVLYGLGSEEVKGFGLTLLLGIASSMFTALFVTRTIFGLLIDRGGVTKLGSLPLTYPKWDRALRPDIDWMSKAKYFYAFSIVFLVLGLTAFGIKLGQGEMLDIEFTKGTAVDVGLKAPMSRADVQALINAEAEKNPAALPSPLVQSIGTDSLTYQIVTPNESASMVREAVIRAMGERLKIDVPSSFKGVSEDIQLSMADSVVQPIRTSSQSFSGFTPPSMAEHIGGMAVVLNDLVPPISPREIKDRIERQRLQPLAGQQTQPFRDVDVEAESGFEVPTRTAVVMISDPNWIFDSDPVKADQWRDELAAPMWELIRESINKQADLQKVVSFDPSVAAETQQGALIALVVSISVIVAYIWFRFGDFKYGTATVVALLHDTLFVLAAVGMAHYVANTAFGNALLIEPFRLNLTLVAAVLTVMGYSMNDTVVVFDRIRENRGKFGAASRQVINDSINQTLSRTLLTGGTTLVTIFVMYIFGGSGIHGFTFALFGGILVGTYSSIAIAAPLLLFGQSNEQQIATPKSTGPVQQPV